MKPWRVGVVGAGYWSENHLKAWQLHGERASVVALCDLDEERVRARGKQFSIPDAHCYASLSAMLQNEPVLDLVDIVTGPNTHRELVCMAASANKHILCQKPFAPTFDDADAMLRAAQNANVRLMVTENWRWMEPMQAIKKALDEKSVGNLQAVRYRHKRYATPRMGLDQPLDQPYFRTMPRLLLYEMGVHWYDTWRFLFGMPTRLYAEFGKTSTHVVGEDHAVVVLAHEHFLGHLDVSWASREQINRPDDIDEGLIEEFVVEGDRATLRLTPTGKIRPGRLEKVDENGNVTVLLDNLHYDTIESFRRLQAHFLDALESGEPFQTSAEDNRETLRLTFATYESAQNHRPVSFGAEA